MTESMQDVKDIIAAIAAASAGPAMLGAMTSSGEKALQRMVMASISDGFGGSMLEPIGYQPEDVVSFEFQVRSWRADLVVFHASGEITVVEMKDGSAGVMGVLGGIGQVGLYATVIGMASNARVRRALLWSRIGTGDSDLMVSEVCKSAGVIPVFVPTAQEMLKQRLSAVVDFLAGERHGAA